LESSDGKCVTVQYAFPLAGTGGIPGAGDIADGAPANGKYVAADGSIATGPRAMFINSQDYRILGADRDAQSKIFVVPVYESEPGQGENTYFFAESVIIMNAVEEAINDLEQLGVMTAEQYFYNQGIHFCQDDSCVSGRTAGVGDMDLDFYVAYDYDEDSWGKFMFGAVFPTGRKIDDPGMLLRQPTGNNGHFEIMIGLQGGVKLSKWFGLTADVKYNNVFAATEWRAAPFKGATIKNIGPKIKAKIKWGYFTGHIDLTVFHPENQNLGFSIGYEPYVKRCDKVCALCSCEGSATTALELPLKGTCCTTLSSIEGTTCAILNSTAKELDASILEKNTKRISHKLRGSVFHRWNYCEIFAGASRVIGGKNIMREAEGHVGFGIYW